MFELPNGRNVTVASSPSDVRAEDNMLRDLRRAQGAVAVPKVIKPPKEKRQKPGRQDGDWFGLPAERAPLASALRQTGLVEQQLRSQVGQLERQVRERDGQIAALEQLMVVKVWRWLKSR